MNAQEQQLKDESLAYHANIRPGKIEVVATKETQTQYDLSLAYSPGVAYPCTEIQQNPENIYQYTGKGNLIAVISNGTAVLGLGDIGAAAGKPVMEGKAVLFKIMADIDVFDLEIEEKDPDAFIKIVKSLEPTFGGINLEDIKAPECFYIEEKLKNSMKIPVMHDDQHGTAIITSAALLNALELQGKEIESARIVVNGAGAAAISCCKMYLSLGAKLENMLVFDSKGIIHKNREDINVEKRCFATDSSNWKLASALKDADVFVGLSVGGVLKKEMLLQMAENPIVFALANPDPEIEYEEAISTREDLIFATGRSDYPNQVNNVLGFPYLFRGALDTRATQINEPMKIAATRALAAMAKTTVPDTVCLAYNKKNIVFGKEYIIPKPMDPRLLSYITPAVAKAAMDSGVAQKSIINWESYKISLERRLGMENQFIKILADRAKKDPKKLVFSEGDNIKVMKAASIAANDGIALPILLGNERKINQIAQENNISLENIEVIDPRSDDYATKRELFGQFLYQKRQRRGITLIESVEVMKNRTQYGFMMVENGDADAMITGITRNYGEALRLVLKIIGPETPNGRVLGMYLLLTKKGPIFLADTTVNLNPSAQQLADIGLLTAEAVKRYNITPRVAMLSYSNFGSSQSAEARLVAEATKLMKERDPNLIVDGEMQSNYAFNQEILKDNFPFSTLVDKNINVLIFPNLSAGNIAYNLLKEIGGANAVGPIILGLRKPIHIVEISSSVMNIVNMATVAVVDAQLKNNPVKETNEPTENKWWKRLI